jgi:hypothetical protein
MLKIKVNKNEFLIPFYASSYAYSPFSPHNTLTTLLKNGEDYCSIAFISFLSFTSFLGTSFRLMNERMNEWNGWRKEKKIPKK